VKNVGLSVQISYEIVHVKLENYCAFILISDDVQLDEIYAFSLLVCHTKQEFLHS